MRVILRKTIAKLLSLFGIFGKNLALMHRESLIRIISTLPDYPSSAASPSQYISLTFQGARKTYETLSFFSKSDSSPIVILDEVKLSPTEEDTANKLENLFNFYGSDKARTHNYPKLYAKVINFSKDSKFKILEIGIGSNNLDIPSNMGAYGKPGASLRAWRDLSNNVEVFGGDLDSRILFSENRINTFQVDQTDQNSWEVFLSELSKEKFDLIVDDGLHSPYANLMSIKNLLSKLSENGVFIVEDINEAAIPVWRLFEKVLDPDYFFRLLKAKNCYVVLIRRKLEFEF